jgi:hypothetical protein
MTADARDARYDAPAVADPSDTTGPGRAVDPAVRPGDAGAATSTRVHGVPATAVVVATYVALAVVAYWPAWSAGIGTHMQLGGDQYANVWYLRWTPFALLHGLNPFFTDYANYPYGVNLVTNTSSPALGVLGMPITLAAGATATFNVLSTVALAGSATAGYAFARRWTTWRPAAWVAGLIYGFSPYEIGQATGHLNLTFVVLPPLILLAVHEVAVGRSWRPRRAGVALGLLVTAQFFVSSELLASTVIMGAVCVVAAAVVGRRSLRDRLRPAVVGTAWAALVAGVLLAYPVWFAVRGPGSISGPIQLVPEAYRADLLGLVVPGAFVWIAPSALTRTSALFANSVVENGSYLGITLVVTVVVSALALWRRSIPVRVAVVGGAVAWILSLGGALVIRSAPGASLVGFPLPERLFAHLPLLSNTVPVRYSLFVDLFASLVLAIALDRLHARLRGRDRAGWLRSPVGSAVLPAIVAVLCLVPVIPSIPLDGFGDPGVPAYFSSASLDAIPSGSVALLFPFPSTPTPQGQLWQATGDLRFRMPGGYFLVPQPPGHTIAFTPALGYDTDTLTARTLIALAAGTPPPETPALHAALVAQLRSWRVHTLLASPVGVAQPIRSVQFLTWLAGGPATPERGLLAWYHLFG